MIFNDPTIVGAFMKDQLQLRPTADIRGFLKVDDKYFNQIARPEDVGVGVCWDNFIGRTCVISIVVQDPKMLTRRVVRECFRYPFEVAGCNAVLALVDSNNTKSFDLCCRSGFKAAHIVPNGGLEGDLVVFQMLRTECPWLRMH